MLRDVTMAIYFGASPELASFFVAYRFVYIIRRFLGEGMLHQGFIPHLEAKKSQDPRQGALFFRDLFATWAFVLIVVTASIEIVFLFLPVDTVLVARWLLFGVFFICLFALTSGVHYCEKSFFLPSASSSICNVFWIFAILGLKHLPKGQALEGLAIVLAVAFFTQWLFTIPKVWLFLRKNLSLKEIFRPLFFSLELKSLIAPFFFSLLGVAALQINNAIDMLFAKHASLEGPVYLWYAMRVQQLPLALFVVALSSALLPSLSRCKDDKEQFLHLIEKGKKQTFTLIFPCMIGIFVLGAASINLLFGHGNFDAVATHETVVCLWCYALGLIPAAFIQIIASAFYAQKEYKIPAFGFLYAALLNILLNTLFIFYFQLSIKSIALSTSFSAWFNFIFLQFHFYKSNPLYQKKSSIQKQGRARSVICCVLAGGMTLCLGQLFLQDATLGVYLEKAFFTRNFSQQFMQFSLQTIFYFIMLFCLSKLLQAQDLLELFYFRKKFLRKGVEK